MFMISRMTLIDAMRATPPSLRISDGTRSKAITAQAPAFSAILACSAFVTSMITPPFSISARPTFTRHSFEPLLPLPLPFGFFPSIFFLLSYVKLSKFLILDTDAPARTVLQSCGSRCPARRSVSSEERPCLRRSQSIGSWDLAPARWCRSSFSSPTSFPCLPP